jgi:hypothetical protein
LRLTAGNGKQNKGIVGENMEITYKKRPLRVAYLYTSSQYQEIPGLVEQLHNLSPEKVIFYIIPADKGEIPGNWKSFLINYDPDFIIYPGDTTVNLDEIEVQTSPFGMHPIGAFIDKYREFLDIGEVYEDEIKSPDDTFLSLLTPEPPSTDEILSSYCSCETVLAYPEIRGAPETGNIIIPGSVNSRGVVDVQFSDVTGNRKNYRVPSTKLFRNIIAKTNQSFPVRINLPSGSGRFSLLLSGGQEPPVFRLPVEKDLPLAVFRELGYSARQTREVNVPSLFRGLSDASRFFFKPYAIPLIQSMLDEQHRHFGSLRKLISHATNLSSAHVSEEILEMLERRVLLRGYVLDCSLCGNEDFYFMKEVDEKFSCRRCGMENLAPLKLPFAVKMNGVVIEGYKNGEIATILTLNYLFDRSVDSFIYSMELSLKQGGREMEIDIACLSDGRIIVGEAKMGKLIKDRDFSSRDEFEKYKQVARETGASEVIFSTLSDGFYDVPRSAIDRFRRELMDEGLGEIEVTILSRTDLIKS